jgi:large subunit ribosomal protein L32e
MAKTDIRAAPKPLVRSRIVKKRTKAFKRPQWHLFKCINNNGRGGGWRYPHGIDSPVRRRYRGHIPMPNKGYGSARVTKYVHTDGFKQFMINSPQDLHMLLMQNRKYAAVIAHTVGAKTRKAIVRKAFEMNVRLVNGNAKVRKLE